jgi:hypothetical protein
MNISKDEARILAAAISDYKYQIVDDAPRGLNLINPLTELEDKLNEFGKDNRRRGRTSQNDWSDLLKRFSKQSATSKS